jgi:hypothetical protein
MVDKPGDVCGGGGEPVHLLVQDVVAPEARPQTRAAHQREEGQAATNRARLPLLQSNKK